MAKRKGTFVLVPPSGAESYHYGEFLLQNIYDLIECDIVERVKVRYRGRVRDCYLDEMGLMKAHRVYNPHVKRMAEEYYGRPCQAFVGSGVIWVPNEEITSEV